MDREIENNADDQESKLVDTFRGLWMNVNNMIGSGIFSTPGHIWYLTGSRGMTLLLYVVGALFSLVGSLIYVELGSNIPESDAGFRLWLHYLKLELFLRWFGVVLRFSILKEFLSVPRVILRKFRVVNVEDSHHDAPISALILQWLYCTIIIFFFPPSHPYEILLNMTQSSVFIFYGLDALGYW
ncbi:6956_t:CDS:2 [Acaulospora morrowiae]|uniref:6956_t:CDS:1 n=1 Tax=Acaulospora morrowiae TaxID=94023 RepID=A0A9N9G9J7_9GLOM|nr:6956_t:CDS:2 [Acaulospora morrowiae]